jgi:hypothetical protein
MSSQGTGATRMLSLLALAAGILLAALLLASTARAMPTTESLEISPGSFHIVPSTTQAAAHADLTTSFDFAHEPNGQTHDDVRTVVVRLPAGFDASNTAVPTCSYLQLISGTETLPACPVASQVGQISFEIVNPHGGAPAQFTVPLYNMEVTSFGVAGELGFKTILFTQVLSIAARPDDLGLTATTPDIAKSEPRNVSVTVWGVPASHAHDDQRGVTCGEGFEVPALCHHEIGGGEPVEAGEPAKPFLSNPTSCEPHVAHIEADSWEEPANWTTAETEVGPIGECDRVPFEPSLEVQPTTTSAESPSGLEATIVVPQAWENPQTLSTANLKDARVRLPVGFTINPSAGVGLGACSPAQYAAESASSLPGQGCPPESKIGSIVIETPLLKEKVEGAVYVATPYDNPFPEPGHPGGALLALYVVAKDPPRGIIVKAAGEVHPDPVTGQLVTTFLNNPQQPFSRFILRFRPGATAPLVSPPLCGSYGVSAALTPWSTPLTAHLVESQPFQISSGVREGACPSGGTPPFHPQAIAGATNNAAGTYSPFYLRVIRQDGEQELTRFSTVMPPGLTGNLTGIPFCPDSAIQAAREQSGAQAEAQPSCPVASKVGHSLVGAGVGTVLAQTPGSLYLAGPYHGAPLSLVSVTSAKVGPFDLGTVVIRFALRINPITAQVEVDATGSDPIPHIIKGIVVHVRDIRAYIDRPSFIKNPTSCERMQIANTVTGAGADPSNPADQQAVNVASPFQAADCQALAFKPSFKASVTGKNSKVSGAGLTVKIAYPNAPQGTQANIHAVKVELPKQLPSRLTTLQKACLASVFEANPASCPAASVVGHATAVTPILPVPLSGPAYFVSNGNARFPELIMVLQGYGITIDLHGETFIDKHGITSSTFHQVPDQPVTSFELTLPQAANSALAANTNLCNLTHTTITHKTVRRKVHGHTRRVRVSVRHTTRAGLKMPTEITAQNGMVIHQATPIAVTGCPKSTAKKRAKHRKAARHRKK